MATKVKTWGVEEIFEAILKQAKEGSCKTCRWCGSLPEEFDWLPEITHMCEIQGNFNAIHFRQKDLDFKAYPWKCDEGSWESPSTHESINECLAYQPGYDDARPMPECMSSEAKAHADFLRDLSKALYLHYAIQDDTLTKLVEKLNASDSLQNLN